MFTASWLIFCWTLLTTKHLLLQTRIRKVDYTVCNLTRLITLCGQRLFVSDDAKRVFGGHTLNV